MRRLIDIQNTLACNLRKYRKASGLSQEKLAELSGMHRTYIGGIEQRRVNVSLKNIGRIAEALGVDPAVLLLPDGEEPPSAHTGYHGQSAKPPTSPAELGSAKKRNQPTEHALYAWHEGKLIMRPIDVTYEDLTIQILNDLILKGYRGSELAAQYDAVHREIISFLQA